MLAVLVGQSYFCWACSAGVFELLLVFIPSVTWWKNNESSSLLSIPSSPTPSPFYLTNYPCSKILISSHALISDHKSCIYWIYSNVGLRIHHSFQMNCEISYATLHIWLWPDSNHAILWQQQCKLWRIPVIFSCEYCLCKVSAIIQCTGTKNEEFIIQIDLSLSPYWHRYYQCLHCNPGDTSFTILTFLLLSMRSRGY